MAIIHFVILILVETSAFPNTNTKGKSPEQIRYANHYHAVFSNNFPSFNSYYMLFILIPLFYFLISFSLSKITYLFTFSFIPLFWLAVFSAVFFVMLYLKNIDSYNYRNTEMKRLQPNIGFYLLVYIYAASVLSSITIIHFCNSTFDFSKPEEKVVSITDSKWTVSVSRKNKHETNHYRIYFEPEIFGINSISVSQSEYRRASKGDKLKVYIKNGVFGLPYININRTIIKKEDYENEELEKNVASKDIDDVVSSILENMIECPPGKFVMGSKKDKTNHNVTLTKSFYIGKYEVTQKEYESVMGVNPSKFIGENNPVECVEWTQAKSFCEFLNKYSKLRPKGYRFDLPTEAQWEYACRAGTTTDLNSGKMLDINGYRSINLDKVAWYCSNSYEKTHPVGEKLPNNWGIYDMHGNVAEWCRDRYGTIKEDKDQTDPTGSNSGGVWHDFRVIRGGSYFTDYRIDFVKACSSYFRNKSNENYGEQFIGFRLALVSEN